MSTHKIDDLLSESHRPFTPLQRLLQASSNQKQWTAELRAHLDPEIKNLVQVSDVRGNTVLILCQNAAIATRVRFQAPQLLNQLQQLQSFNRVTQIILRVANHG